MCLYQTINIYILLSHKYCFLYSFHSFQESTAVGNDDHKQNVLKKSKDNMSNNSQGAVNSGHGKAKENNKGGKKGKK